MLAETLMRWKCRFNVHSCAFCQVVIHFGVLLCSTCKYSRTSINVTSVAIVAVGQRLIEFWCVIAPGYRWQTQIIWGNFITFHARLNTDLQGVHHFCNQAMPACQEMVIPFWFWFFYFLVVSWLTWPMKLVLVHSWTSQMYSPHKQALGADRDG